MSVGRPARLLLLWLLLLLLAGAMHGCCVTAGR